MDVVLEVADYLVFDRVYSAISPLSATPNVNATLNSIPSWQHPSYVPASQYLPLGPTQYTYASSLDRDNIYRQAISLYLITWYG